LGLEAGGTRSEAVLADANGSILGHGLCSFDDPEAGRGLGGSGRSEQSMRTAIVRALSGHHDRHASVLHVIGRGRLPADSLSQGVASEVRVHSVREQDGPLALVGATAGVVVLAGTGAFVYGRRSDGRELMLDALGPLLGDAGSAFDIGLRALRAIARASWHPRHATSLERPLRDACARYAGNPPGFNLVEYMLQHRDRSEVASLARIVDEHAESGDAVAVRVLKEAADAVAETLRDVVDRLGLGEAELPLVAAGSVARKSRTYWARVCERARTFAPGLRPHQPAAPEVIGTMLAGAAHIEGLVPGFRSALLKAAQEL
jgi:N-acetylglucosamine kinase-like BadF-type ATPase